MKRLRDNVKEFLVKLLLKLKEVRPAQAAPLKKESVYLKVKLLLKLLHTILDDNTLVILANLLTSKVEDAVVSGLL